MDLKEFRELASCPLTGTLAKLMAPCIPPGPDAHIRAVELANQFKDRFAINVTLGMPDLSLAPCVTKSGRPVQEEIDLCLSQTAPANDQHQGSHTLGAALLRLHGKEGLLHGMGQPGGLQGGLSRPGPSKPVEPKPPFSKR